MAGKGFVFAMGMYLYHWSGNLLINGQTSTNIFPDHLSLCIQSSSHPLYSYQLDVQDFNFNVATNYSPITFFALLLFLPLSKDETKKGKTCTHFLTGV